MRRMYILHSVYAEARPPEMTGCVCDQVKHTRARDVVGRSWAVKRLTLQESPKGKTSESAKARPVRLRRFDENARSPDGR